MKKYHLILFLVTIIYVISMFNTIYKKNLEIEKNKIINTGDSLAERILNINKIVKSDDGLYKEQNKYVFKGNANNYIIFSNNLWRIVSLEEDGTIKIVKDSILKNISYDELNTKYFDTLDKKKIAYHKFNLSNTKYANIKTKTDIEKINEYYEEYYVGLLDIKDVVNASISVTFDEYLDMYFWINKSYNYLYYDECYMIFNKMYIEKDFVKTGICNNYRPSLYLKSNIYLKQGKGTKDKPYILGE